MPRSENSQGKLSATRQAFVTRSMNVGLFPILKSQYAPVKMLYFSRRANLMDITDLMNAAITET
jgi:hypothetical protein